MRWCSWDEERSEVDYFDDKTVMANFSKIQFPHVVLQSDLSAGVVVVFIPPTTLPAIPTPSDEKNLNHNNISVTLHAYYLQLQSLLLTCWPSKSC